MKKAPQLDPLAPHPNLDIRKAVRGKYFARYQEGTNLVLIPDSESVNEAPHSAKNHKPANRTASPMRQR